MNIQNNTLKNKLSNVYFIWGSGKTTTANALAQKHGFYVYHTDDSRSWHFNSAEPEFQPAMCRDVPDFWALEKEDALAWETDIVREMTPMIIADLIQLSSQHKAVICEGDIDVEVIMPVVTNCVVISNYGKKYDFFDRPEQSHMLDEIRNRTDITEDEKAKLIENAYKIVTGDENEAECTTPRETLLFGVKEIVRDDTTTVDMVVKKIENYWGIQ